MLDVLEFLFELIIDFVSDVIFDGSQEYALTSRKGAKLVRFIIFAFLAGMSGLFIVLGFIMREEKVMMYVFYMVSLFFAAMYVRFLLELKKRGHH